MKANRLWPYGVLALITIVVLGVIVRPWQSRARASAARSASTDIGDGDTPSPLVARRIQDGLELPDPAGTLSLEGIVLGPDDEAVAGATVRIDTAPPRRIVTDENGAFELSGLLPRRYQIAASAAAGVAGPLELVVTAKTEPLVLRLRTAAQIVVEVVDADGHPVEAAEVAVLGLFPAAAVTDAQGRAIVTPIAGGTWIVRARKAGYAPDGRFVVVPASGEARVDLRLQRGASLAGRVVDEHGAPLAGVRVWPEQAGDFGSPAVGADSASVSDVDGRFRFDALAPMGYRLVATAAGRPLTASAIVVLTANGLDGVELRVPGGATLRGRVIDADRRPVAAQVRVYVERTQELVQVRTADDGRFVIDGLSREAAQVTADSGAATAWIDIDLSRGNGQIEIVLAHTARIAGTVVDGGGEPLLGAQIQAWSVDGGPSWRDVTDAAGHFELPGLAPGKYVVRAGREVALLRGLTRALPAVTVAAGTEDVRLVLAADGAISGEVVGTDGEQVGYRVRVLGTDAVPFATVRFTLDDLPVGPYSVWIEGPGFAAHRVDGVVVTAGATTDLGRIVVLRGRSISGRVVTTTGSPVEGATVRSGAALLGTGGQITRDGAEPGFVGAAQGATTDASGAFALTGVSAGGTTLVADAGDRGRSPPLALPASTASVLDLVLVVDGVASLSGLVTVDGRPTRAIVNAQPDVSPLAMAAVPAGDDGTFRFDRLAPGTYTVAAVIGNPMAGGTFHPRRVEVLAGQPTTRDVIARRGDAGVEVTVEGAPVAAVFVTSAAVAATDALALVLALGRQDGGQWAMAPALGGPATLTGLVPGRWSVCAIVPPLTARDMGSMLAHIAREGSTMPARCSTVEISSGAVAHQTIVLTP